MTPCVKCGSEYNIRSYKYTKDIKHTGLLSSYQTVTYVEKYIPVCTKCLKEFKVRGRFLFLAGALFWIGFMIILIGVWSTPIRELIIFLASIFISISIIIYIYTKNTPKNPHKYIKFLKSTGIFYVKPEGELKWIPYDYWSELSKRKYEKYRKLDEIPKEALDLYNAGVLQIVRENLEDALDKFNEALTIHPEFPDVLSMKGELLIKLERYEDALKSLDDALTYNPNLITAKKNKEIVIKILNSKNSKKK